VTKATAARFLEDVKLRLEMVQEMQIEILNAREILVNCKFKLNKNLDLNLYRKI